jgi:hypothetical protein
VGHEALGLDAKGLDIEEPDGELNALILDSMEPDTGLEVLCCNLLVLALLS